VIREREGVTDGDRPAADARLEACGAAGDNEGLRMIEAVQDQWLIAAGIVVLVIAAVVWWRRR
jgi:LPXTG-motif cell wall-anchored protein